MPSSEERKKLLKLARESIESCFSDSKVNIDPEIKKKFSVEQGVFVTLKKHGELRGCIGFPEPVFPLYDAIMKAAEAAAFEDPRFIPVSKEEMNEIIIEISILSIPALIEVNNPDDYFKEIEVGRDGLIVKYRGFSGLLLPQVAPEQRWNAVQFLEGTCEKAGVPKNSWRNPRCEIYKFQGEIFSE